MSRMGVGRELANGSQREGVDGADGADATENLHMKELPLFDDISTDVEVGVCHFSDVSP